MKHAFALALAGAFAVAAASHTGIAAAAFAAQKSAAKTATKTAPPPIAVEVIAVDPAAKTITVRDIAAVPATPGKAVEVKLPVPASATGEKIGDVKVGEKVDVTCAIKPTVHPTAGVPIVLTDCVRVIKIEPKS
jgi:protein-disulfide isomerase